MRFASCLLIIKIFYKMKIIKIFLFLYLINISFSGIAQTYLVKDSNVNTTVKDYKASRFGIKSDGRTLNTNSIQRAIDFINATGGGRLVFYVGRYLTGSIQLKSNVTIHLEEGAVLVSSTSIYDYTNDDNKIAALVSGTSIKNTGITGKGVLEGSGLALMKNIKEQSAKGFIEAQKINVPSLVSMDSCQNILLSVQNYIDVAATAIRLQNSSGITIDSAAIKNISIPNPESPGIVIQNCKDILISNCFLDTGLPYINVSGKAANLKLANVVTANGQVIKFTNEKVIFTKK